MHASSGEDNNGHPRFSPDGRWIAFVHSDTSSLTDASAELRLVPSAGGPYTEVALSLSRANGHVDGSLAASTMPAWAPSTHPGTQWLVFSSTRSIGLAELPQPRLWAVGVELGAAAGHIDPSYAAFLIPQQGDAALVGPPQWTHDYEDLCAGSTEVCDGYDNNCDGVIDEDCAVCEPTESCADGTDNDCDGLIDESCPD